MDYRNLVTVNECYGSPNLIWNAGTMYLSMTVLDSIPYMEYSKLVTVNDCYGPKSLNGMQNSCKCQ